MNLILKTMNNTNGLRKNTSPNWRPESRTKVNEAMRKAQFKGPMHTKENIAVLEEAQQIIASENNSLTNGKDITK